MEKESCVKVVGAAIVAGLDTLSTDEKKAVVAAISDFMDENDSSVGEKSSANWSEVHCTECGCPNVKVPVGYVTGVAKCAVAAEQLYEVDNTYSAAEYFCNILTILGIPFEPIFD